MKKQEIISVLMELNRITGFRVSLHGADYGEIAAYPEAKSDFCRVVHSLPGELSSCIACDKAACEWALTIRDTYIYTCRYGLTEAVSPLYNFGTLTGFLVMGQVYKDEQGDYPMPQVATEDTELKARISEAMTKIPRVKGNMIKSYVRIMTICAQYLTLSNAIPREKPTVAQLAKNYIYENFRSKISIKDICTHIGCSKSTLITSYKKEYGMTVGSYITEVRLAEAERMLSLGEKTIGEIAIASGFSDQSYFSKVFSSKHCFPPSEYRQRR